VDKHRWVLNELVKKDPSSLNSEPFSILLKYPTVLDFRVKERYFRYRLKKLSRSQARQPRIRLNIHREHIFRETFQQLQGLRGSALRAKIDVQFVGEEGIDAGGLVREWYYKLSHEIVNAG
jgi:E3 ubiquitin-protein ligase HUWE1